MVLVLLLLTCFNTILLLAPFHELTFFFELEPISAEDIEFRAIILSLPAIHLILAVFIEVIAQTQVNEIQLYYQPRSIQEYD